MLVPFEVHLSCSITPVCMKWFYLGNKNWRQKVPPFYDAFNHVYLEGTHRFSVRYFTQNFQKRLALSKLHPLYLLLELRCCIHTDYKNLCSTNNAPPTLSSQETLPKIYISYETDYQRFDKMDF